VTPAALGLPAIPLYTSPDAAALYTLTVSTNCSAVCRDRGFAGHRVPWAVAHFKEGVFFAGDCAAADAGLRAVPEFLGNDGARVNACRPERHDHDDHHRPHDGDAHVRRSLENRWGLPSSPGSGSPRTSLCIYQDNTCTMLLTCTVANFTSGICGSLDLTQAWPEVPVGPDMSLALNLFTTAVNISVQSNCSSVSRGQRQSSLFVVVVVVVVVDDDDVKLRMLSIDRRRFSTL
jgi:hypothetical protein